MQFQPKVRYSVHGILFSVKWLRWKGFMMINIFKYNEQKKTLI